MCKIRYQTVIQIRYRSFRVSQDFNQRAGKPSAPLCIIMSKVIYLFCCKVHQLQCVVVPKWFKDSDLVKGAAGIAAACICIPGTANQTQEIIRWNYGLSLWTFYICFLSLELYLVCVLHTLAIVIHSCLSCYILSVTTSLRLIWSVKDLNDTPNMTDGETGCHLMSVFTF